MQRTKIEWTRNGYTWNPTTGCTHVSDGCRHCYAEAISLRFKRSADPWVAAYEAENVKVHPERLMQPFAIKEPAFCFVDSMSDLFHRLVPDEFIVKVWAVMLLTPHVTYQVLTKRPERMAAFLRRPDLYDRVLDEANLLRGVRPELGDIPVSNPARFPAENIWLGTSVEDQRVVDRIEWLARCPARVRFLSCEPLIGPLDLSMWLLPRCPSCLKSSHLGYCEDPQPLPIAWVITGGESGPNHRPFDPQWARDIRDQCLAAGVAYFHKQNGGLRPKSGGRELDGRTWDQMPAVGSAVRSCRVCGCTEEDCSGCVERSGKPCHWVAADLSGACAGGATDGA